MTKKVVPAAIATTTLTCSSYYNYINKLHFNVSPCSHTTQVSTTTLQKTLLTNLTQHVLDGINSKRPAQRPLLATIDISKAFNAMPRHRLTDKIYNTNIRNTKRWLANYLGGRQAHVSFNGKLSHTRNFPWVPQGSVQSPTLFNLYMHDTLPTPANTNIMSYADDFTITSTHNSIPTATALLQNYLNTLQIWFDTNRLKVAPIKSTITLITNYTKEHQHTHSN